MAFPADLYGWERVRGPDAVPSADYRYLLDEAAPGAEAALAPCDVDMRRLLSAFPPGAYSVQVDVQYTLPADASRQYQESEPFGVRVPLSVSDYGALHVAARTAIVHDYGMDGWMPIAVYLKIWQSFGGVELVSEESPDARKRRARDDAREEKKRRKRDEKRRGGAAGSAKKRQKWQKRVDHVGSRRQQLADPSGLLRAVAQALHPSAQGKSAEVSETLDALTHETRSCVDDAARLVALESGVRALAITVVSPTLETLRAPSNAAEAATELHLTRDDAGVYALLTDVEGYKARHPLHRCGNRFCKFEDVDAAKVRRHENTRTCVGCEHCGLHFGEDAANFEEAHDALVAHKAEALCDPSVCVERRARDSEGGVKRLGAKPLPRAVGYVIALDIEAIPAHGVEPRGVAIRLDDAGRVRPLERLVKLGANARALKLVYADGATTRAPHAEGAPVVSLTAADVLKDPAPLARLGHGDVFEIDGARFANAVAADRTTAGDQLTTMVCFYLAPALARKLEERGPLRDAAGRWEQTAPGAYRTTYREDADGAPLLDLPILEAALDFLDAVDERLRALSEGKARWWARCALLSEWCYARMRVEDDPSFAQWKKGKTMPFWRQYMKGFVEPELRRIGVTEETRYGLCVDARLGVTGEGADVTALRAWLGAKRSEYDKLVEQKLGDLKHEGVTILAHNGSGYDYYKFLKALLARGAEGCGVAEEEEAEGGAEEGGEATNTGVGVKALENGGKLLSMRYLRFTFHDSILHIGGALAKLAKDFGAGADDTKGCAPHGWYATTSDRAANWGADAHAFEGKPAWWRKWSNDDLVYKPARRFFVEPTTVKTASGTKLEGFAMQLTPEQYAAIPGKDPEGELHGPGMWNSFEYFATYCAQDVRVLFVLWQKWCAAVLETTRYAGEDAPHATLAAPPLTVLSIDPGWSTGYCVLRVDADGRRELLACGTAACVKPETIGARLRAAVGVHLEGPVVTLVEQQPYFDPSNSERCLVGEEQWQRMKTCEAELGAVRVDSGYPKLLGGDTRLDTKEWAKAFAPHVAEKEGVVLSHGLDDHACDAFLQAAWWLRTHVAPALDQLCAPCDAEGGDAAGDAAGAKHAYAQCLACVRKYGTRGCDPSACVTISQLTTRAYKASVTCELPPTRVVDPKTQIVVYQRRYKSVPRYMPPQGLSVVYKAEDQVLRAAMRGGRTDTGALLYEIDNPCRCPLDRATGRRVWHADCGKPAAPEACPTCGAGVTTTRLSFECTACDWRAAKPKRGVAEHLESWDVTSLYPYCLMGLLPVPNGVWLSADELAALDLDTFLFDDGYYYVVTCDLRANPTCFYPIASQRRKVKASDACEKLVFDDSDVVGSCVCGASPPCYLPHGPECRVAGCDRRCHGDSDKCAKHAGVACACTPALTLCSPELQIALNEGCRIEKLHCVLRYEKADYMRAYIDDWAAIKNRQDEVKDALERTEAELAEVRKKAPAGEVHDALGAIGDALAQVRADVDARGAEAVVEARLADLKAAYNPAMRAAAKLILNSIYGRTLMRERDTASQLMTDAQRRQYHDKNSAPLSERHLGVGGTWLVTTRKEWQPARGLPCAIGVFCLSLSKVVLWEGVTGSIALGGTWLGGDTDCSTVALPHGVEFPLELRGGGFGKYTQDYARETITGWANPMPKVYAYRFEHDPKPFGGAALAALQPVRSADATRLRAELENGRLPLEGEGRRALVALLHANHSKALTHALVDVLGPETMKLKGARVNDNLGVLGYATYAALASGDTAAVDVRKKQLLKLGWCALQGQMFTEATVALQAKSDKRRALALEPPLVELPPGQLPKAGIRRRLTVPWGYAPLPTTTAQLALCVQEDATLAALDSVASIRRATPELLDALKVAWAKVRRFPVDVRRTLTRTQRDERWAVLAPPIRRKGAPRRRAPEALFSFQSRQRRPSRKGALARLGSGPKGALERALRRLARRSQPKSAGGLLEMVVEAVWARRA